MYVTGNGIRKCLVKFRGVKQDRNMWIKLKHEILLGMLNGIWWNVAATGSHDRKQNKQL